MRWQNDPANGTGWRKIDRVAASHDGMTILPTAASIDPAAISVSTPFLTYQFHTFSSGNTIATPGLLS